MASQICGASSSYTSQSKYLFVNLFLVNTQVDICVECWIIIPHSQIFPTTTKMAINRISPSNIHWLTEFFYQHECLQGTAEMTFLLDKPNFRMHLENDFSCQRLPHEYILSMCHNTTSHILCIRTKALLDSKVVVKFYSCTKTTNNHFKN